MRKLLSADISRLFKSKIFWILEGAVILWGLLSYGYFGFRASHSGSYLAASRTTPIFYHFLLYIAGAMAILCSQFFGTEYEHGTLRNKLIVGHKRWVIYFSSLLVTILVGILFSVSHMLTAFIAVPFAGIAVITSVGHDLWRHLCWLLLIAVYGALFTLFAMLDSRKSRNALISVLLALVLIWAGACLKNVMADQLRQMPYIYDELGQLLYDEAGVPIRNTAYLQGPARATLDWAYVVFSQGWYIMDKNSVFDIRMPLCSLALITLLTGIGITAFQKKDFK